MIPPAIGHLGGKEGVNTASGEIEGQRNGTSTVPVLRLDQSREVGVAVALGRDDRASGADGPHVGGAVAGDGDRATAGADAVAMRGASERGGLERGALGSRGVGGAISRWGVAGSTANGVGAVRATGRE
jgi:hypothetical protein